MKLLMLFADGFEDVEAVGTLDVLLRGGDEVVCASLMSGTQVKTKCGNVLTVATTIDSVDPASFDGLIIPGGPASFRLMPQMPVVSQLIREFADSGRLVAAICAAPHLVGKLGYFRNRRYTVHPGFEGQVIGGTYCRDEGVVTDGNFITGKSMFYSLAFGAAVHAYFHGRESADKLLAACQGEA